MFNVIKTYRGKQEVVFTGEYAKAKQYIDKMMRSQRKGVKGNSVSYRYEPTDNNVKYQKAPHQPFGRKTARSCLPEKIK